MDFRRERAGLLTAGTLAGITLLLFGGLQDYGPESAIRRFHHAVATDDANELRRVTLGPITTPAVGLLIQQVKFALQETVDYRVSRMDRVGDEVTAVVVYTLPQGNRGVSLWVVERDAAGWRVNARRSRTLLRDALDI